jgi:hypothetical protein
MSEDFLERWSRRKREAGADTQTAKAVEADEADKAQSPPPPLAAEGSVAEPEIDLSALPPIDSITAASDITMFLRKGIPQDLARAALRRAWTADAAIRDFVGLAENAWDFNDPNAMPGFGPLNCSETELSALVDRILGGVRKTVETLADPEGIIEAVDSRLPQGSRTELGRLQAATRERGHGDVPAPAELSSSLAAAQPRAVGKTESEFNIDRGRAHGSALPRDDD